MIGEYGFRVRELNQRTGSFISLFTDRGQMFPKSAIPKMIWTHRGCGVGERDSDSDERIDSSRIKRPI